MLVTLPMNREPKAPRLLSPGGRERAYAQKHLPRRSTIYNRQ